MGRKKRRRESAGPRHTCRACLKDGYDQQGRPYTCPRVSAGGWGGRRPWTEARKSKGKLHSWQTGEAILGVLSVKMMWTGGGYDQRWVASDTEKSSGGESESSAERRGVGNETGRAGLVRDTDNQNVCMLV